MKLILREYTIVPGEGELTVGGKPIIDLSPRYVCDGGGRGEVQDAAEIKLPALDDESRSSSEQGREESITQHSTTQHSTAGWCSDESTHTQRI